MAKIYIVEDDENIREFVLYALLSNGFEAAGFENAQTFWKELQQNPETDGKNLILLDIMLPDEDGISILKKLRKTSRIPVIMLTAKSGEYDKVRGLDLGADDYITKPFSILELLSRIKAVLRRTDGIQSQTESGEPTGRDEVITHESIQMDIRKHTVKVDGATVALTFKEFELLQYLLQNKGFVLSRDKIMDRIWGFDFEGESRTVDMHIKTLRQKLEDSGRCIETVRGIGYRIGD